MADITNVVKHFAVASETYTDNLSASISSLATEVPVNSAAAYDDGDVVVLTVEPGTTNEATFTGTKASSPDRFINCVWTEGNKGVGHASGATIIDYDSATHFSMLSKGVQAHANQDGTLKTSAVQAALNISAAVPSDYTSLAQTITTNTYNGNRSYTVTFPGVDYTDRLSPGMRLRTVRSAAAPTQSASLNGTSQYFSRTSPSGMTFTDDFVVSAWVKLSSYSSSHMTVVSRFNNTSGWELRLQASTGQVMLAGFNGANTNFSYVISRQSIPLNKWVHISAQLDMSSYTASATTSYIMIDGVDVPVALDRGGTFPTALVQAGNLEIGTSFASQFFPGKIAQVAIFSAKVTQATMRGYISQGLSGSETSLVSAFSLSNSLTDLNTTNANNLTANGGAVATNADSPFGTQASGNISSTVDYGIIQKVSYSSPDTTVVVQVPEGNTIPTSGGVASVSYSQFKAPYGFPTDLDRWRIELILGSRIQSASGIAVNVWVNNGGLNITVPTGSWKAGFQMPGIVVPSVAVSYLSFVMALSTSASTISNFRYVGTAPSVSTAHSQTTATISKEFLLTTTAATQYYFIMRSQTAGATFTLYTGEDTTILNAIGVVYLEPAYL